MAQPTINGMWRTVIMGILTATIIGFVAFITGGAASKEDLEYTNRVVHSNTEDITDLKVHVMETRTDVKWMREKMEKE